MQPDAPEPKPPVQPDVAPAEIPQAQLERFRKLQSEARDLNWVVESMRKRFLEQLAQGTPIEPGPLDLEVAETSQRRMTNEELVRILGFEVVENVRASIVPTVSKSLKVVERPVKPAAKSRRRNVA